MNDIAIAMVDGRAGMKYANASQEIPAIQRITANTSNGCQRLNPSMNLSPQRCRSQLQSYVRSRRKLTCARKAAILF
ncbi:MAG: hypothetical protein WAN75_12715 [Xanthobacteraceae bacterium]